MRKGMRFVFPTLTYKDKAIEYISEFYEYGSEINGSGALDRFLKESTYEKWLDKLVGAMDIANLQETKVLGLTYDKENIASAGVIKNCGGLLKEEFYSQTYDEVLQMYVIKHEN